MFPSGFCQADDTGAGLRDHLKADLTAIRDMSGTLQDMHRRLDDAFTYPPGDFAAEAGAADLAAALGEFTDNWTIRQQNLLADLEDLARVAEKAAEALKATDAHMADVLRGALTGAETPPPPQPGPHGRRYE